MNNENKIGKIKVFSNFNSDRNGYVEISLDDICSSLGVPNAQLQNIRLKDKFGNHINHQIDERFPNDRSKDVLIFKAKPSSIISIYQNEDDINRQNYSNNILKLIGYKHYQAQGNELTINDYSDLRGIELLNDNIKMWFALSLHDKLAGCSTSFSLNSKPYLLCNNEMLDFWKHCCNDHDPRKHFMKINKIVIPYPMWDFSEISLDDINYSVVYHHIGSVRATVTLKSTPITIHTEDEQGNTNNYNSCLYRLLSIYPTNDFILEELILKITYKHQDSQIHFSPYYSMFIDFGYPCTISKHDNISDWFSISNDIMPPFPSYGFATNSHCERPYITNEKEFNWNLRMSKSIRNIHSFAVNMYADDRIGRLWYENILDIYYGKITKE